MFAKYFSPGPMSEISSDLIGRARARGRIRVEGQKQDFFEIRTRGRARTIA